MKLFFWLFVTWTAGATGFTIARAANRAGESAPRRGVVAFVDVTLVPMDSERILPRQTVIVRGDRIEEIGPVDRVNVPEGVERIDGRGKFLMPGLAEMHGHFPPGGSAREFIENVAFLYVANGVTTVRSMLGAPGHLEFREQARRGEFVSPTLYMAGPSFSGQSVPSPQAAIERVRTQKNEGWDLLKVHPGLKREVYDAMAATAKEVGIEFSGHVPAAVGLVHAIRRGQRTIDHLDGYIEYLEADRAAIDRAKLADVVKLTRETNTWVVPTMVLWETIIGAANAEERASFPELRYMPRAMVESWTANYRRRLSAKNFDAARADRIAANRKVLLKALADGGVNILFGTDAPQQFSVPGFSIHRELAAMKAAGMANFAILRSATKNVGDYYKGVDEFGTIAIGQRADIIVIDANPLDDLGNLAKRVGVMVRGRWIPDTEIKTRLETIAAASK